MGRAFANPADEFSQTWVGPQLVRRGVITRQLSLAQTGMYLFMTDMMQ